MKKLLYSITFFAAGFAICLVALKMDALPLSFYPQLPEKDIPNTLANMNDADFYAQTISYSEMDNSSVNGEIEVTASNAQSLMNDYQYAYLNAEQKKTNGSLGGSISVEDLNKLVTECKTPCNNINFRLGYETAILPANRKVVLLFSTGSLANPSGNEKIYSNSVDGYCPTRCN